MTPDTEVISCPACRHLVRVPADWLGTIVQCPECRATFRAPVRAGDRLTEPELLTAPARPAAATSAAPPPDAALWIPAFGLMLVGVAGLLVDVVIAYRATAQPNELRQDLVEQFRKLRESGFGAEDPEADRDQLDRERAAGVVSVLRWAMPAAAVVALGTFAGGLAIALRRGRRLAQLGCVLASLHLPALCCVPGAVLGIWGLFLLRTDEGKAHFR